MKIIVTTYPFDYGHSKASQLINEIGELCAGTIEFNEKYKKYSPQELEVALKEQQPDIIIAGTELYDSQQLGWCPNLKMISRVGIGLDSVNLEECRRRNIVVTNTPDGPSNAVAELAVLQILTALRSTNIVDQHMRKNRWKRIIGREIKNCRVGVIGAGRIGSLVIEKLESFRPKQIMYTDTDNTKKVFEHHTWSSKQQILEQCDVITVHIPLNAQNKDYLGKRELSCLKEDAVLINTSRGSIINESALYEWLKKRPLSKAAVDVFEEEPYVGKLLELPNILVTPHLGSCTKMSREAMATGALQEVLNFLRGAPPMNEAL